MEELQLFPLLVGDDSLSFQMWKMLYDSGVFVNVFISPGVPAGQTNDENKLHGYSRKRTS